MGALAQAHGALAAGGVQGGDSEGEIGALGEVELERADVEAPAQQGVEGALSLAGGGSGAGEGAQVELVGVDAAEHALAALTRDTQILEGELAAEQLSGRVEDAQRRVLGVVVGVEGRGDRQTAAGSPEELDGAVDGDEPHRDARFGQDRAAEAQRCHTRIDVDLEPIDRAPNVGGRRHGRIDQAAELTDALDAVERQVGGEGVDADDAAVTHGAGGEEGAVALAELGGADVDLDAEILGIAVGGPVVEIRVGLVVGLAEQVETVEVSASADAHEAAAASVLGSSDFVVEGGLGSGGAAHVEEARVGVEAQDGEEVAQLQGLGFDLGVHEHRRGAVEVQAHGRHAVVRPVLAPAHFAELEGEGLEADLGPLDVAEGEAGELEASDGQIGGDQRVIEHARDLGAQVGGTGPGNVEQGGDVGQLDMGSLADGETEVVVEAEGGGDGEVGSAEVGAGALELNSFGGDDEAGVDGGLADADDVAGGRVVKGRVEHLEVRHVGDQVAVDPQGIDRAGDLSDGAVLEVHLDVRVLGDAEVAHQAGELQVLQGEGGSLQGDAWGEGADLEVADLDASVGEAHQGAGDGDDVILDANTDRQIGGQAIAPVGDPAAFEGTAQIGQGLAAFPGGIDLEARPAVEGHHGGEAVGEAQRGADLHGAGDPVEPTFRQIHAGVADVESHLAGIIGGERTTRGSPGRRIQVRGAGHAQPPHQQTIGGHAHTTVDVAQDVLVTRVGRRGRIGPGELEPVGAIDGEHAGVKRHLERRTFLGGEVEVDAAAADGDTVEDEGDGGVGDAEAGEGSPGGGAVGRLARGANAEIGELAVAYDEPCAGALDLDLAGVDLALQQGEDLGLHGDPIGLDGGAGAVGGIDPHAGCGDGEGPGVNGDLQDGADTELAVEELGELVGSAGASGFGVEQDGEGEGERTDDGEQET